MVVEPEGRAVVHQVDDRRQPLVLDDVLEHPVGDDGLGLLELAIVFLVGTTLDSATEGASRMIRTGQFQMSAANSKNDFKSLGDLKSLAFKGVGPQGGDIYDATFANGQREFRVLVDAQGRIDAMGIQLK